MPTSGTMLLPAMTATLLPESKTNCGRSSAAERQFEISGEPLNLRAKTAADLASFGGTAPPLEIELSAQLGIVELAAIA